MNQARMVLPNARLYALTTADFGTLARLDA